MMATDEIATDVGTVLYGEEAVSSGLMDGLGSLSDALGLLHRQIDRQKSNDFPISSKNIKTLTACISGFVQVFRNCAAGPSGVD